MTTKKRGRPLKPASDKASALIPPIRVTTHQKKQYTAAAKACGATLSAWLRDLADQNS